MTFLSDLARLREAATKWPWKRTGFSRIRGVSANGMLKTEDADFICYLVNHAEAIEELVRAAEEWTAAVASGNFCDAEFDATKKALEKLNRSE